MSLFEKLNVSDFGSKKDALMVRTGIDVLDYKNAKRTKGKIVPGIDVGNYTLIIGRSGSGKTTLAVQISSYISEQYNSEVVHFDFERATSYLRVKNLMKTSKTEKEIEETYKILNTDITTEKVYNMMVAIKDIKTGVVTEEKSKGKKTKSIESSSEEFIIEDEEGNKILKPTPMIIDSVVSMYPEKVAEEESINQDAMLAQRVGKVNSEFFQKILQVIWDGNIIPFFVNHIRTKLEINAFAKTSAVINYLKQDETIPGGLAQLQFAHNLFKMEPKNKLTPDEGFGIKGFMAELQIIKSRSAESGYSCMLVYNQATGFDNLLTNYYFLDEMKKIQGGGRGYFIETCPDVKFTKKTFKDVYNSNPKLKKAFDKLVIEELEKLSPDFEIPASEKEEKLEEYGKKIKRISQENLKNKEKFKKVKDEDGEFLYYESKKTGRKYGKDGYEIDEENSEK